jgi:predicted phosphodiesterase
MKIQLLSDLHLESENFVPAPAPGAELLVLAGDIDARWHALEGFAGWPVPVIYVPGNHEFDGRDIDAAEAALRARCRAIGLTLLHREVCEFGDAAGRRTASSAASAGVISTLSAPCGGRLRCARRPISCA